MGGYDQCAGAVTSSQPASRGRHVFGDQQEQVVSTLGGINADAGGGGNDLVKKLVPLLAPLVLSFVAKQVAGRGGAGGATGGGALPGGLGDLLGGGRKKK